MDIGFYLAGIAITTAVESWLFGERWRHAEVERWIMGVLTVLGWQLPFLQAESFTNWLMSLFGFGTAALITLTFRAERGARIVKKVEEGGREFRTWRQTETEGRGCDGTDD